MNLLRPFKFQLALVALLSCKLNEAMKLILKQKVGQSQPDFAIWIIEDVPLTVHLMLLSADENKDHAKLA